MMIELANKVKNELNEAKSLEEVKEILCVAEYDNKELIEEAEQIWKEIEEHRGEGDKELDVDELEAVSGGADRNWVTDGCAATCEEGSRCMSNDYCTLLEVTYEYFQDPCMGNHDYKLTGVFTRKLSHSKRYIYTCTKCGKDRVGNV